jgi:hypothetical protein
MELQLAQALDPRQYPSGWKRYAHAAEPGPLATQPVYGRRMQRLIQKPVQTDPYLQNVIGALLRIIFWP